MRQHAHPIRRPGRRRRRVAIAAALGAAVLVTTAALVWRPPTSLSPAGLTAGPNAVTALEPTPSPSAPRPNAVGTPLPTSIPSPTPPPKAPAAPAKQVATALENYPSHVAMDGWLPRTPAPPSALTGYVWPIAHPRLTLPFGPTPWGTRVVNGALFHDGVDLATFCGDRIMAAHDGVVLAAGRHFDNVMGWVGSLAAYYHRLDVHQLWQELPIVVVVDDGNGYRSMYAHFSKVVVHVGQQVRAGQLIGYEGMSGHATGCHLHYGLFSPLETATFGIEPKVARDMRLPTLEIARIDPLIVLPYRRGLSGAVKPMGG